MLINSNSFFASESSLNDLSNLCSAFSLSISIITDFLPSQINNIDILIADRRDLSRTQFRIMTDFPDHLNLRDGVVLTKFGHLEEGQDYNFTIRVFLNPNLSAKAPVIKGKT